MSLKCILAGQKTSSGNAILTVEEIWVETPPTKTAYLAGDTFDPTGMQVMAKYFLDGSFFTEIEVTGYSCSPQVMTDGLTEVIVSYGAGNDLKTDTVPVTVTHKLQSIAVTTPPTKTTYEYGEKFSTAGMVVTATYSDGATATITNYTHNRTASLELTHTVVTITYTENGVTKTCTQALTVNRKTITVIPSQSNTLTYNGSAQSPTWNNYSTTELTLSGTTSGTAANDYTASFTPTANYRWSDGTVSAKSVIWTIGRKPVAVPTTSSSFTYDGQSKTPTWSHTEGYTASGQTSGTNATPTTPYTVTFTLNSNYKWSDGSTGTKTGSWSIAQATGTLTLGTTTAAINGSNYSSGVQVTASTNTGGQIKASSSNSNIASVAAVSNGKITIKGNGSSAGSATITVSVELTPEQTVNYTQPSNKTISVTATYFTFNSGLNNNTWQNINELCKLHRAGSQNIASYVKVGDTKTLSLTTAVQGASSFTMEVVDINKDGNGTITFCALNMLPTYAKFSESNAQYSSSNLKTYCGNVYNYATVSSDPAKPYIKQLSKGTNTEYNTASVAYTNEYVWIPSIFEVGLGSYQYAPKAEEYTNGVSSAYAKFSSNANRVKKQGDSGSADRWWTRSRGSGGSGGVCFVYTDGSADYSGYNGSRGMVPAFCIGV